MVIPAAWGTGRAGCAHRLRLLFTWCGESIVRYRAGWVHEGNASHRG
jgi:hypothetical protein